jgi:hypothetical protein
VSYRNLVGAVLLASSLTLGARVAHSQPIATDTLRARGTAAYARLPVSVTLRDAPLFSDALRYLYAYEQRALREGDRRVHLGAESALDWLSSRIANMKTGKGDQFRNDDDLRDRGLAMYEKAKNSERENKIWDVQSYLSASANLFAYSQVVSDPGDRVRTASRWLGGARSRLVTAGVGSADAPGADPEGWLPPGKRPGAGASVVVQPPPGIGKRTGAGARAGSVATSGVVGSPAPRDTVREPAPVPTESANPARTRNDQMLIDSMAKLYLKGNLRETRDIARSMLNANPSDGDAHMALVMIYSKAAEKRATPEDRALLWLASDHLNIAIKARAIGFDLGQKILQDFESGIPTADDLKSRGWIAGQRLRVSFAPYEWVDEETTIRPRKR